MNGTDEFKILIHHGQIGRDLFGDITGDGSDQHGTRFGLTMIKVWNICNSDSESYITGGDGGNWNEFTSFIQQIKQHIIQILIIGFSENAISKSDGKQSD